MRLRRNAIAFLIVAFATRVDAQSICPDGAPCSMNNPTPLSGVLAAGTYSYPGDVLVNGTLILDGNVTLIVGGNFQLDPGAFPACISIDGRGTSGGFGGPGQNGPAGQDGKDLTIMAAGHVCLFGHIDLSGGDGGHGGTSGGANATLGGPGGNAGDLRISAGTFFYLHEGSGGGTCSSALLSDGGHGGTPGETGAIVPGGIGGTGGNGGAGGTGGSVAISAPCVQIGTGGSVRGGDGRHATVGGAGTDGGNGGQGGSGGNAGSFTVVSQQFRVVDDLPQHGTFGVEAFGGNAGDGGNAQPGGNLNPPLDEPICQPNGNGGLGGNGGTGGNGGQVNITATSSAVAEIEVVGSIRVYGGYGGAAGGCGGPGNNPCIIPTDPVTLCTEDPGLATSCAGVLAGGGGSGGRVQVRAVQTLRVHRLEVVANGGKGAMGGFGGGDSCCIGGNPGYHQCVNGEDGGSGANGAVAGSADFRANTIHFRGPGNQRLKFNGHGGSGGDGGTAGGPAGNCNPGLECTACAGAPGPGGGAGASGAVTYTAITVYGCVGSVCYDAFGDPGVPGNPGQPAVCDECGCPF